MSTIAAISTPLSPAGLGVLRLSGDAALVVNLDSLISLTVPMMFGLLSGFYSSTFLACTFWAGWAEKREAVAKDKKASQKRKKKA